MTTAAQIRRELTPLLERHPDLALVGRYIVVKPVTHVLRAVLIDRTGIADAFNPRWFAMHLFELTTWAHLTWGELLFRKSHGNWKWSKPDAVPILCEEIETNALPQLRAMTSLHTYLNFVSQNKARHLLFDQPHHQMIMDVALGDFTAARLRCADPIARWLLETDGWDSDGKDKLGRAQQLCRLLAADDRAGMAALLHAWEAQTVRNLKIEHLWEPTPFPLETMPH